MQEKPTVQLCECGCGEAAPIAPLTNTKKGWVKGQPKRFVNTHHVRLTPEQHRARFWTKVEKTETCWLWLGAVDATTGYGAFRADGVRSPAHRFAYELMVGPIPEGLVIDHLCRVRHCVNPAHMEPVTRGENVRRGLRGRLTTHCPQGHEYTPENTYLYRGKHRQCRACGHARQIARRQETKQCEQCGREGTRGFTVLGPVYIEHLDYTVPAITICANQTACMKRWPKPTDDRIERMYL